MILIFFCMERFIRYFVTEKRRPHLKKLVPVEQIKVSDAYFGRKLITELYYKEITGSKSGSLFTITY